MKLIKTGQKTYALEVKEILDHERPPMMSVSEYQAQRRKISSSTRLAVR
jgi:hypothetical protein